MCACQKSFSIRGVLNSGLIESPKRYTYIYFRTFFTFFVFYCSARSLPVRAADCASRDVLHLLTSDDRSIYRECEYFATLS